jgi:hypothetical protein
VTEADVQRQIFDALVWDGWLVLRVNSGAMRGSYKRKKDEATTERFIRFITWQMLGFTKASEGVSDLLAFKDGVMLGVECKAPGKKSNTSGAQQEFLEAVRRAGGVPIVADSLADLGPYLSMEMG